MRVPALGLCAFTLSFCATIARADVLDVGGATPDHADISSAVNAAQDGDVIRIWPGNYQPFTVLGKSLTLVQASGGVSVLGTVRIRELGPSQAVELSGINGLGTDGRGLIVSECLGSVRIREGIFRGANASDATNQGPDSGARIFLCSDVELTNCSFQGGSSLSGGQYAWNGADGLELVASHLSAFGSSFQGSGGAVEDDPGASGGDGGNGIGALGTSRSYISGCTLIGGDGAPADPDPDWVTGEYGYGGDGGWGFDGVNTEAWFLDNVYMPGDGGWSPHPDHHGSPGQATSAGTYLHGLSRGLQATRLLVTGSPIALQFEGEPGDQVYLRVASAPDYQFSPTLGPTLVAAPPITPFGASDPWTAGQGWHWIGTIDASGALLASLPTRELPAPGHVVLHFQAAYVGARTSLGSSSWSAILDPAW